MLGPYSWVAVDITKGLCNGMCCQGLFTSKWWKLSSGSRKEEEGANVLVIKLKMSSERGGGFRKAGSRRGSAMLLGLSLTLSSMFVSLLGSPSPAV